MKRHGLSSNEITFIFYPLHKTPFMEISEVRPTNFNPFSEFSTYFDSHRLFYAYTGKLPSVKTIDQVDPLKFKNWLVTEYGARIVAKNVKQQFNRKENKLKDTEAFFLLDNNILIYQEVSSVSVLYDMHQEVTADQLLYEIKRFKPKAFGRREIFLVSSSSNGIETVPLKLKKPQLNLGIHYNDDLITLHLKMLPSLKKKDTSGLYLFHGIPGTGKSTYIRHLVCSINKKVIFIPPVQASQLDSTNISKLLIKNENSVFIIEDAEDLLHSRNSGNNSAMSTLLNLTDGILGKSLGIQIIVTFNTNPSSLDRALLRKGRLTALYEFKPLAVEKANILLKKLGMNDYAVFNPTTLADLFHAQEKSFQFSNNQRNPIGFLNNAV